MALSSALISWFTFQPLSDFPMPVWLGLIQAELFLLSEEAQKNYVPPVVFLVYSLRATAQAVFTIEDAMPLSHFADTNFYLL